MSDQLRFGPPLRHGPSGAQHYTQQVETCRRKNSYGTKLLASNAAWILNLIPGRRPAEPYRCPICADWHTRTRRH